MTSRDPKSPVVTLICLEPNISLENSWRCYLPTIAR